MNIDLSKKSNSMSAIIQNNHEQFDSCSTVSALTTALKTVFEANNLNTAASNRLIANVASKKNITDALMTVYNSLLCGSKLAVDQK